MKSVFSYCNICWYEEVDVHVGHSNTLRNVEKTNGNRIATSSLALEKKTINPTQLIQLGEPR